MQVTKTPTGLKAEGRRLWRWLSENFTMAGAEPLAEELCRLADRLAGIRQELNAAPKVDVRLVNAEMKVTAAYARAWKALGLSADDIAKKNRPGYPAGVPRRRTA